MTNKERKQNKHSLKTSIDTADRWIQIALISEDLGVIGEADAAQTLETIRFTLKEARQKIANECNLFLAEIDDVITKISQ